MGRVENHCRLNKVRTKVALRQGYGLVRPSDAKRREPKRKCLIPSCRRCLSSKGTRKETEAYPSRSVSEWSYLRREA